MRPMRLSVPAALLLCLGLAAPASAQSRFTVSAEYLSSLPAAPQASEPTWTLPSTTAREWADHLSTGVVAVEGGLWGYRAWHRPDRSHAIWCGVGRLAATYASTEILKRATHRTRPNGVDDKSFPSQHTAFAMVLAPKSPWGYAYPAGVATGRVLSSWHYVTDTLVGGGIGWLIRWGVCPAEEI